MSRAKPLTIRACACRWSSLTRTGGCRWPNSGSSPPLELKWLATTITVLPFHVNSPASGLRLEGQPASRARARERLAAGGRRRVVRLDAPRAERELRPAARPHDGGRVGRRAAGPVDEGQPA